MLFSFSKKARLNRIIKKAVAKTAAEFSGRTPTIYEHFFYGAFELAPQYLVIWYLFETDAELESAQSGGYCDELREATIRNLIDLGYPKDAFADTNMGVPDITFVGGTPGEHEKIMQALIHRKAMVSFTTKEDIDNKTGGDYRMYFQ